MVVLVATGIDAWPLCVHLAGLLEASASSAGALA